MSCFKAADTYQENPQPEFCPGLTNWRRFTNPGSVISSNFNSLRLEPRLPSDTAESREVLAGILQHPNEPIERYEFERYEFMREPGKIDVLTVDNPLLRQGIAALSESYADHLLIGQASNVVLTRGRPSFCVAGSTHLADSSEDLFKYTLICRFAGGRVRCNLDCACDSGTREG